MKAALSTAMLLFLLLPVLYCAGLRWNPTPSVPKGIYRIAAGVPTRGDLVAFCLEGEWVVLARERGYLGPGNCSSGLRPLLKRLAGLPGDALTVTAEEISIVPPAGQVHRWQAPVRRSDAQGRPLPESALRSGVIPAGMGMALAGHAGSFDSRFFGLIPLASMVRVEPVFTFKKGGERHD